MSKILEKSLANPRMKYLLRQWREWAIDLYQTYKSDLYFSVKVKIVALGFFGLIIVLVIIVLLVEYVEYSSLEIFMKHMQSAMTRDAIPAQLFAELRHNSAHAQLIASSAIALVTLLVALISTRLVVDSMKQAVHYRKRFLSNLAHELRTPLAILKTQNEVALFESNINPMLAEMLQQNVQEVDNMSRILNDLLLSNRVSSVESIPFEMVTISTILDTVISRLQKNNTHITFAVTGERLPQVYGNATALEQAFFNIINNACAYSKRSGTVTIMCENTTEEYVSVYVSDTGIGIKATDLPHIFEPFYRTEEAQVRAKGLGLGLALVYEIIKLHHGKVRIESELTVGTTVTVALLRQHPRGFSSLQNSGNVVAFDFTAKDSQKVP
jgi:signal transduction histidine kinase